MSERLKIDELVGYGKCLRELQAYLQKKTGGDPALRMIDTVNIIDDFIQVGINKLQSDYASHEQELEESIATINTKIEEIRNVQPKTEPVLNNVNQLK